MVSLREWPDGSIWIPDCVGEAVTLFGKIREVLLAHAPNELRVLSWCSFPGNLNWEAGEPNKAEHEIEAVRVEMIYTEDESWSVRVVLTLVYVKVLKDGFVEFSGYRARELRLSGCVAGIGGPFDVLLSPEELAGLEVAAVKPDDAAKAVVGDVCKRLAAALPRIRS